MDRVALMAQIQAVMPGLSRAWLAQQTDSQLAELAANLPASAAQDMRQAMAFAEKHKATLAKSSFGTPANFVAKFGEARRKLGRAAALRMIGR